MPRDTSDCAPWVAMCISRTTYYKRIAESRARERLYACLPDCYHSTTGLALDKAIGIFCNTHSKDYTGLLQAVKHELERQEHALPASPLAKLMTAEDLLQS